MSAKHPAPYPRYILARLALYLSAERRRVGRPLDVLDPFAGIGRIHDLPRRLVRETVGVEIEPEWASRRAGTIVGDATALPSRFAASFDAVVTSPCYANRLADHHEAKDNCGACGGTGAEWSEAGCGDAPWLCPDCQNIACVCGQLAVMLKQHNTECAECRRRRCKTCHGRGVSVRHTYRHALGRMPSANSAAVLQWSKAGGKYRALHSAAWTQAHGALRETGLLLVNVKNHIDGGIEQPVVEWHAAKLTEIGFDTLDIAAVPAPGIRHGANHESRVECEQIIVARKRV